MGNWSLPAPHLSPLRYFQCAEGENERTFLAPGRIATGDIGRFGKNGDLFVLGRKGETIVTATGQKIHPEIVERELNNCPDIGNSVIFQRPNTAHLSCVRDTQRPRERYREAAGSTLCEWPAEYQEYLPLRRGHLRGYALFTREQHAAPQHEDRPPQRHRAILRLETCYQSPAKIPQPLRIAQAPAEGYSGIDPILGAYHLPTRLPMRMPA